MRKLKRAFKKLMEDLYFYSLAGIVALLLATHSKLHWDDMFCICAEVINWATITITIT